MIVSQAAGKLVVTVDESPAQALAPPAHLSTSPRLKAAQAQLPAGSQIPLFIDFRGLGQLLQGLTNLAGPQAHGILAVLGRLNYLVVGSNRARGDLRLVLALR